MSTASNTTSRPPLDAEQRFELASIAARDERRNRPAHWLLFATLFFVFSLLALFWAGWSRAAAEKSLGDQRYIAQQTSEICGQILALRKQGAEQGDRASQPVSQIRSRLQAIGVEAGIKGKIPLPKDDEERKGASKRVKFTFANVQDESLPALLGWLDRAVNEIPGVEVYSVSIRPQANQWLLNVTFARWERAS